MTRIDSTKVLWRVQVRKSREHAWKNKGLWEVRRMARDSAWLHRIGLGVSDPGAPYGFGNTRVVRHISGKGPA
jgi:hypothetical protein